MQDACPSHGASSASTRTAPDLTTGRERRLRCGAAREADVFEFKNPYPTVRIPVFARNVVSTSHPLAAQAGLRMLAAGGNAVDAALAGAAMLIIVEPVSCGLGGDAFAIVWDGAQLHGLNASGVAPQAWSPDYFRAKYGEDGHGLA